MKPHYRALAKGLKLKGRYVVGDLLGTGRSSAVYDALDVAAGSQVALKVLDPEITQDEVALARFHRETAILASLSHPHVVRVHEFFEERGLHVICMEKFGERDLKAHLRDAGALSFADFQRVATALAQALWACHRRAIVHRDVKPNNVLLTRALEAKLTDFGIAKVHASATITRTGTILGTPEYMAPELFAAGRADFRSDIFSLGAVLYEMLSGKSPAGTGSVQQLMAYHMSREIRPVAELRQDVPTALAAVVHRCLRLDPGARFQSCQEVLDALAGRGLGAVHVQAADAGGAKNVEAATCLTCKGSLLPRVPFCHLCGRFLEDTYAAGPFAVVLRSCRDVRALLDHVRRSYGRRPGFKVEATRVRFPALYVGRVSQETAIALAHELSDFDCEVEVVRSLSRQFRMPWYVLAVGFALPCLPFFIAGASTVSIMIAALTVVTEALVFAYFLRFITRVIVTMRDLKAGARTAMAKLDERVVALLAPLTDPSLKTLLARIYRSYRDVRHREATLPVGIDGNLLGRHVEQAFVAARALEARQAYLATRSLADVTARIHAADARLKSASDVASAEPFVRAKAELLTERAHYVAAQDEHGRLIAGLLNFLALLERLRQAAPTETRRNGDGEPTPVDDVKLVGELLKTAA
jgi:hypothetical protein